MKTLFSLFFAALAIFSTPTSAQHLMGSDAGESYRAACKHINISNFGDGPWLTVSAPDHVGVWYFSLGEEKINGILVYAPRKCNNGEQPSLNYLFFRPKETKEQNMRGITYGVTSDGYWIRLSEPVTKLKKK
jgi:hypothetical protein